MEKKGLGFSWLFWSTFIWSINKRKNEFKLYFKIPI